MVPSEKREGCEIQLESWPCSVPVHPTDCVYLPLGMPSFLPINGAGLSQPSSLFQEVGGGASLIFVYQALPSMALSNSFVPFLLLFFILSVHLVDSRPTLDHDLVMINGRSLLQAPKPTINCGEACAVRCSKSWKQKMCKKMCGVCCSKCSCVPPGTSVETRATCPCYANMRNPKGQLKCP